MLLISVYAGARIWKERWEAPVIEFKPQSAEAILQHI